MLYRLSPTTDNRSKQAEYSGRLPRIVWLVCVCVCFQPSSVQSISTTSCLEQSNTTSRVLVSCAWGGTLRLSPRCVDAPRRSHRMPCPANTNGRCRFSGRARGVPLFPCARSSICRFSPQGVAAGFGRARVRRRGASASQRLRFVRHSMSPKRGKYSRWCCGKKSAGARRSRGPDTPAAPPPVPPSLPPSLPDFFAKVNRPAAATMPSPTRTKEGFCSSPPRLAEGASTKTTTTTKNSTFSRTCRERKYLVHEHGCTAVRKILRTGRKCLSKGCCSCLKHVRGAYGRFGYDRVWWCRVYAVFFTRT